MTQFFLHSCLGLSDYRVRLSKSDPADPKYQGSRGRDLAASQGSHPFGLG